MPRPSPALRPRDARDDSPSFLGRGWTFPVALDEAGDASLVEGNQDVRQAIWIILGTAPGERVMRPDFGAGLNDLVFEPMNTTTIELVKVRVEDALTRWEPRITLQEVAVTPNGFATGRLDITISYLVRESNTEANLVYPFYLAERGQAT